MSLYCDADGDYDDCDWWWVGPSQEEPLATKRSRRCCSCGAKISVGDVSRKVYRYRHPTEFEENRGIASDEVALANWYLCEECGDLSDSLTELGFCYSLGDDSLRQQIKEYKNEQ